MQPAITKALPTSADGPPQYAAVVIAFLFLLAMSWGQIPVIWSTGAFADTDDAARMAQVRDLIAGQGWFDLTQRRLAPPDGHPSHWTRVVDAPLAALILFWSVFFDVAPAEALARLSFTASLHLLLLWGAARLGKTLMGEAGVVPALAVIVFSGIAFGQFQWGRIDHHGPQLVVVLFTLEAALRSLEPGQAWRSALAGLLAALSISINVETIGLVAVACAAGPVRWAWRGGDRGALFGLAGGLGAGLSVGALLFIPHGEAARLACDALSPAMASAGYAATAGLVALGLLAPRLPGPGARLAAGGAAAIAVAAVSAWINPHCLGNPYGAVDPLVRELWQDLVSESRPMAKVLAEEARSMLPLLIPTGLATLATFYAALRSDADARPKWITMAAASGVALVVLNVESRALSQLVIAGVWGGAYVILRLWREKGLGAAIPALLAFSPLSWALTMPGGGEAKARPWESCYKPATFEAMASLPPGAVVGPVFLGSHILAHTPHSVLAAPYHRMTASIRTNLDILIAEPAQARALAAAAGVRYVAVCFDPYSLGAILKRGPNGLAAALTGAGAEVEWLRLAVESGPLRVYEVRAPAAP